MVFNLDTSDSFGSSSFSTSEAALPARQSFNCPDGCLRALVSKPVVTGMERLKSYNRGEISRIINKASKIGEGAFGEVHLGTLDDGTSVAVKLLSKSSWQGRKEFLAETQLSSRAHHGNLVSLLGYCDHSKKMALVYEFMANGNLEEHLSVCGLDYLHNRCNPAIIHRDLKASNILLSEETVAKISDLGLARALTTERGDYMSSTPLGTEGYLEYQERCLNKKSEEMVAKISDLGLARALTTERGDYKSSTPLGTLGYLDPEYQQRSFSLNKKSDVYSLGIVLFELITGHPAIMERPEGKSVHILEYVTPFINNEDNMLGLMDPRLEGRFNDDSAKKVVKIAESCTRGSSAERPDISEVLTQLQGSLPRELTSETKWEEGKPNEQLGTTSSELDAPAGAMAK